MIYLFAGSDHARAYQTFSRYLAIMRAKQPEATVLVFTPDNLNQAAFEEAIFGQSLFLNKHIVAARRLSEDEAASRLVLTNIKTLTESSSAFLFYEPFDFAQGKPGEESELVKTLAKHAKDTKIFNLKTEFKPEFNIFALANNLGARDRECLWLDYERARRANFKSIDIFWKLWWQVKNMMIVTAAPEVMKTELKPTVAARAVRASRNFRPDELAAMLTELAAMYHETYPDSDEFNFRLEKFILSV